MGKLQSKTGHVYNTKCIATSIDNKHLIEQWIRYFVENQQSVGIKSSIKCDASFVEQKDNIYLMRRKQIGIFAKSTLDSVQCFTLNTNNNKFHILPCRLNNKKTIWVQAELFPNTSAKNESVLGFVVKTSNVIVIHLFEKTIGVLENRAKKDGLADYQPDVANPYKATEEIPLINPAGTLNSGCDNEYVNFLIGELQRFHQRGLTTISIPELIENSYLHRVNSASIDDDQQLACARTPVQYESSDDEDDDEEEECMVMNNDDDSSHAIYNLERSLIPSHNNDSSAPHLTTSKTSLKSLHSHNSADVVIHDFLQENKEQIMEDDLDLIYDEDIQAYVLPYGGSNNK